MTIDTNIIIDIFRGDEEVVEKVKLVVGEGEIFVTSISLCELYKGAYGHINSDDKLRIIEEFFDNANLVTLSIESSREFGLLWQNLKKKGKVISDFDILIASMIKTENLTLITSDKHFRNLGINVIII